MNEELDSQLSAMFDDELPGSECELLARRLSRDEALKSRWGRYALIGAVIRAECGVVLQSTVAGRVNAALSREPRLAGAVDGEGARAAGASWARLASGAGLAAAVAATSIFLLRWHALGPAGGVLPSVQSVASVSTPQAGRASFRAAADSFVVPPVAAGPVTSMPPTELADYVVAHSAYSWPFSGGSVLSSLMVSAPGTRGTPVRSEQRVVGHGHEMHSPH